MRVFLSAVALTFSMTTANAQKFTVSSIDDIGALPCAIFNGEGIVSLKNGITLEIPLSPTNNSEMFSRIGERSAQCREIGRSPIVSEIAAP